MIRKLDEFVEESFGTMIILLGVAIGSQGFDKKEISRIVKSIVIIGLKCELDEKYIANCCDPYFTTAWGWLRYFKKERESEIFSNKGDK